MSVKLEKNLTGLYLPAHLREDLFSKLRTGAFYKRNPLEGYSVSFVGKIRKKGGHLSEIEPSALPFVFAQTPEMVEPLPLLIESAYFDDDYSPEGYECQETLAFVLDTDKPARIDVGEYRKESGEEPCSTLVDGVEFYELNLDRNFQLSLVTHLTF